MKKAVPIIFSLITTVLLVAGCMNDVDSDSDATGAISVQLNWHEPQSGADAIHSSEISRSTMPSNVSTVRVQISASDMTTVQQDFEASAGEGTVENVPVGSGRKLRISGLDADGNRIYASPEVSLTITEGEVADAGTLDMISVSSWMQQAYVKSINSDEEDGFGYSISIYGDLLAVGVPGEDSSQRGLTNGTDASSDNSYHEAGAVFIYKWTGTMWEQQAYIKPPNTFAEVRFGLDVSLYGTRLAVSSFDASNQSTITNGWGASDDQSNPGAGAVYIYKLNGSTWNQEAYIKASNNDADDWFGWHISLTDDTLAVGAQYEDSSQTTITNGATASSDNSLANSGAVYIYRRTNTSWAQEAYIKATNASAEDQFGWRVAVSGDTLAVSAYMEDSSQNTITNGTSAASDDDLPDAGAVYIYQRTGTEWEQQAYIKAANPGQMDWFGKSISLSGDVLVVGSFLESSGGRTIINGSTAPTDDDSYRSGAAYVYRRTGSEWVQEAFIKASNADEDDRLGRYIALDEDGDRFVVSAEKEDSDENEIVNGDTASDDNTANEAGAVYIYKYSDSQWTQEAYIKAANSDADDIFGEFLDISGNRIAVGARFEDSGQRGITNGTTASINNSALNSGAAYIYTFIE